MSTVAEQNWLRAAVGGRVQEFYAAIGIPLPDRGGAEASVSCFANPTAHKRDDRTPSCSVNLISGLFKCHGCGQAGNPFAAALSQGHAENRARELAQSFGLFLEVALEKPKLPNETQVRKWRERLAGSPKIIARLGEVKGWTPQAIVRCGLGWDGERVTFPIRNHKLKLVGLVRYLPGGDPKSKALAGSKRLLFPAPEILSRKRPLFITEGEPDAVSVRSCGHQAVAVPGANGWRHEFAQRLAGHRLIVLVDCDRQGRDLADRIAGSLPRVRVVDLEPGREDGYDFGDMVVEAMAVGGTVQLARMLDRLAA